jgi:hypothetical protein
MPLHRIPHSRAHLGLAARQLVDRCRQLAVHELVTYAELSALVGVDVQKQRRDLLANARRELLTVHGILLDVSIREGVVRLDNTTGLEREARLLTRQHAAASRMAAELKHGFAPETMTPAEHLQYLGHQTIVAAVHLFTSPTTQRQVTQGAAPPALVWNLDAHKDLFGQAPRPPESA